MDQPLTSLDRFLYNRAPAFIGLGGARMSIVMNGALGGFFSLLGVGFLVGSVLSNDPGMAFGSIGPFIGGGVNLLVAGFTRKRASQLDLTSVKLTDEAKRFLHRLMRQVFGWRYQWIGWEPYSYGGFGRLRRRRLRRFLWGSEDGTGEQRPSADMLRPEVFAALDGAAKHYNRIQGQLVTAESSGIAVLKKMRPAVMQAADETMAEVLHNAALMEKYPEGSAQAARTSEKLIESLKEAADHVEALVAREPGQGDGVSAATTMDSVLEELRLQDMAGAELQAAVEEQRELRH